MLKNMYIVPCVEEIAKFSKGKQGIYEDHCIFNI